MHRIVCAGHVNWDVTLQVESLPAPDGETKITDQTQSGGGSASNTAVVLAGLACDPVLLGAVGDDNYGTLVRRELTDAGVDCAHVQRVEGATTVKYLIVDESGQVMVLANDGANEQFSAEELPGETLREATHLHLTSQTPETALELAERARDAGLSTSFDPGRRIGERDFDAVVDTVDIAFFNAREATTARENGLIDAPETLTIVKRGGGGASAHTQEGTTTHQGFDVDPVDTAGAGDAFAAGFLAARLEEMTVEQALAVGNACGALAVQSVGARTAISWDEITRYCESEFQQR